MKALVRNLGETITEASDLSFIDWSNGAPLTDKAWSGGRYTLVLDYVPPQDAEDEPLPPTEENIEETAEEVIIEEDTVIIDGKTYTKDELRALLRE